MCAGGGWNGTDGSLSRLRMRTGGVAPYRAGDLLFDLEGTDFMSDERARLDSRLEAEGAEFLVLAHLLLEGVQAMKAYTRYPGWDLLASDPEHGSSCRIQVKSRWATDYDRSFPLKNTDTDFVVLAALNRGYRGYGGRRPPEGDDGRRPPQLYVFPIETVAPLIRQGSMPKVRLADMDDPDQYLDRWDRIKKHLAR